MDETSPLNTPHVPADAGIYAEGYLRILNRIPLGWGKWISCDKGWYKLLTELEADLAEIFPFYAINQVKEKYGTLRFYTANPDMTLECCKKFLAEANRPKFKANSMITDEEKVAMDTWYETYEPAKNAHDLTPEHIAMQEVQDALYAPYKGCGERFEARIVEASEPGPKSSTAP